MRLIETRGEIRDGELDNVLSAFERMGYAISYDAETGEVVATRPQTLTKGEFKQRVVDTGHDTPYYAGVVWGRLGSLRIAERSGLLEGLPLQFTYGSWSAKQPASPNFLIEETILPSVDWLNEHRSDVERFGVNDRFLRTLEASKTAVASQLAIPTLHG
jgi:hypothetical protein